MFDAVLKSMGIDPQKITEQINGFGEMLVGFQTQLNRIENKLDKVLGDTENERQETDTDAARRTVGADGEGFDNDQQIQLSE